MERDQRAFGFTSLLLAMTAVGPLNERIVEEAMATIKRSDIDEWAAKEIGQSIQSQRRQIKKIVANSTVIISKTKKIEQKNSGILERKVA